MRIITLKDVGTVTSDITDGVYLGAAISAWSGTANYAVGDIKYYTVTRPNYVYRCIETVTHTTGTEPIPELDTKRWVLIGTTDRDAEFDDLVNTLSQRTTSHTVTVDSSGSNYVAFFNLDAVSVTLTLTVSGSTVKTETVDLRSPLIVAGWYEYFFADRSSRTQLIWEYPKYATSTLVVTMTNYPSLPVKCGAFRWGSASPHIAGIQKGVKSDLLDYSSKGTVYAVNAGPSADNIDFSFHLPREMVDEVKALAMRNVGRVAIYDCNDDGDEVALDSFVLLAIYRSFSRVFEYQNIVKCNLSIQGVI